MRGLPPPANGGLAALRPNVGVSGVRPAASNPNSPKSLGLGEGMFRLLCVKGKGRDRGGGAIHVADAAEHKCDNPCITLQPAEQQRTASMHVISSKLCGKLDLPMFVRPSVATQGNVIKQGVTETSSRAQMKKGIVVLQDAKGNKP